MPMPTVGSAGRRHIPLVPRLQYHRAVDQSVRVSAVLSGCSGSQRLFRQPLRENRLFFYNFRAGLSGLSGFLYIALVGYRERERESISRPLLLCCTQFSPGGGGKEPPPSPPDLPPGKPLKPLT